MNICKEELKRMIEHAFRSGMNYGYGVEHTNITEDENKFWKEYSESLKLFKPRKKIKPKKLTRKQLESKHNVEIEWGVEYTSQRSNRWVIRLDGEIIGSELYLEDVQIFLEKKFPNK